MALGVPGTGKTVLTNYLLNTVLGLDSSLMQLNVQSSGTDLLGEWSLVNGIQVFKESPLIEAMREGKPVIIDEADKPRDETALAVLNNILQDRFIVLPNDGRSESERTVFAKEGFFVVTAGNLAAKGGTASTRISGEVLDRHSVYVLETIPKEQAVIMLERYAKANGYEMPEDFIESLVNFHYGIMEDDKIKQKPSMRTLEKTIGTLARDPSRFNDVKGVYLEGFSTSKQELVLDRDFFILSKNFYIWQTVKALNQYIKDKGYVLPERFMEDISVFYSEIYDEIVKTIYAGKPVVEIFKKIIDEFSKLYDEKGETIYDNKPDIKEFTSDMSKLRFQDIGSLFFQNFLGFRGSSIDINLFDSEKKYAEFINNSIIDKLTKDILLRFTPYIRNTKKDFIIQDGYLNTKKFAELLIILDDLIRVYDELHEKSADISLIKEDLKIFAEALHFMSYSNKLNNDFYSLSKVREEKEKFLSLFSSFSSPGATKNKYKIALNKKDMPKGDYLSAKTFEDVIKHVKKVIIDIFPSHKPYIDELHSVSDDAALPLQEIGYLKDKDGTVSIDIGGVRAPINSRPNRETDPRRVKLFLSGSDNAREVFPERLTEIPETIYYQVADGEKTPFVFTSGNKEMLKRMLAVYGKPETDARNSNLWLEGQKGIGKNALSFVFAGLTGMPMRFVSLHANTTQKDISERTVLAEGVKKVKIKGADGKEIDIEIPVPVTIRQFSEIYEAAKSGELVIIDEADKVKLDGVLSALNTVLTRDNIKGLTYSPGFRIIVLSNDHKTRDVSGKDLNVRARDFISRLTKIEMSYPSKSEEIQGIIASVAQGMDKDGDEYKTFVKIIGYMVDLAAATRNGKDFSMPLSPRSVLKIAKHLRIFPKDRDYLKSVIATYYGQDLLSEKERKSFNSLLNAKKGLNNQGVYGKDFMMGYDKAEDINFEYSVIDETVYVSLGAGDYKVSVPTKINPKDMSKMKLNDQYCVPANMFLFWQWMKDIKLGNNIMVLGVPGTGKTVLTNYLLNNVLGNDADMQTLSVQTTGTDLFGEWSLQDGQQIFTPSLIVEAMKAGKPIIIDEADKPRDETALAALNNILQSGFVTLPDGTSIHAKKGFFAVCEGNLPNTGGTASTRISGEVLDRHSVYVLEAMPKEQAVIMLERYAKANGYEMPKGFIESLVNFHYGIMEDDKIKQKPSMRTLEKTIGTLARDPSRFNDVKGVYLEGFSTSKQELVLGLAFKLPKKYHIFGSEKKYAKVINNAIINKSTKDILLRFTQYIGNTKEDFITDVHVSEKYKNQRGYFNTKKFAELLLILDDLISVYEKSADVSLIKKDLETFETFLSKMPPISSFKFKSLYEVRKSKETFLSLCSSPEVMNKYEIALNKTGMSKLDYLSAETFEDVIEHIKKVIIDILATQEPRVVEFPSSTAAIRYLKDKDGTVSIDIGGVRAPINSRPNRETDPRRVKLFLSGSDNAREVFPERLTKIPQTIYYQIGDGVKTPFVFTSGNKEILKRMLAAYGKPETDARNSNLWLEGEMGGGKNALSFVFAGLVGAPMRFVSLHANTTQKDISERTVIDTAQKTVNAKTKDGKKIKVKIPVSVTRKQFSEIYEAAQNGELVIIDEADKVKLDGVLSALNTVLTRNSVKGLQYHPNFRVIVLSNDHQTRDVSGKDLNIRARDFISRLSKIAMPYPSKEEEIQRVMGSVFGDLKKGSREYDKAELIMDDIITVAQTIRNSKVLTRPLSPRSILRIAKLIKAFPQDKNYLYSLINASYGVETLSVNEEKEFKKILKNILGTKGLDNEYPKDFLMGYDKPEEIEFEYFADNGKVYISLGKGEHKVSLPAKISPENIETAKSSLKEHYHIPANMVLFWRWMKDISIGGNIMVLGVPGTGKTVLTSYLLNDVLGFESDLMQMNVQSSGTDLFGQWAMENGKMVFKDSLVVKAMLEGKPVIIDEVDKPRDETALAALN
ncbi:MAG: AAA family ATPase, partial [Endomicrobium sp.]|nr:AAA family ATPase [Endomicrobium sp.]